MPWGLKRFQQARCLHFITFSCYRREPLLAAPRARDLFEVELERVRRWYGFYVSAYVVMPEHVHLLVSEPERKQLSVAIQMLKQIVSRKLRRRGERRFWQTRYYDFLVPSEKKRLEKLHYMHQNPVKRGLVQRPDDWKWSSFLHIATGREGTIEIESQWTASKRERMGHPLRAVRRQEQPHPVAPTPGATRVGQPQK
jgi:putative transposase